MTLEENVLEIVDFLGKSIEERKKIEKEMEEFNESREKESAEIKALKEKILSNKHVTVEYLGRHSDTIEADYMHDVNVEVDRYRYSFFGEIFNSREVVGLDYTYDRVIGSALKFLLNEEELIEKLKGNLKKEVDSLQAKKEQLNIKISNEETKLAQLEAELSLVASFNVLAKMALKSKIKKVQSEIANSKKEIDDLTKNIEKLESEEYVEKYIKENMTSLLQLKEDMALYVKKGRQYDSRYLGSRWYEVGEEEKALKEKIKAFRQGEKEAISKLMSSDCVKVLIKIAKDPETDSQTKETVSKVLKFIASKEKETKNNNRK